MDNIYGGERTKEENIIFSELPPKLAVYLDPCIFMDESYLGKLIKFKSSTYCCCRQSWCLLGWNRCIREMLIQRIRGFQLLSLLHIL